MRQSQIPYPIDSKEKTVDYRGGNIVNILVIHSHNANRGDFNCGIFFGDLGYKNENIFTAK